MYSVLPPGVSLSHLCLQTHVVLSAATWCIRKGDRHANNNKTYINYGVLSNTINNNYDILYIVIQLVTI